MSQPFEDWQPTFDAVHNVPGSTKQQPAKKTVQALQEEAERNRRRQLADVAIPLGFVDTGDNDPADWLSDYDTDKLQAIIDLDGRVTALEGGGTVTTYTVSGTWTNPHPSDHVRIKVICVNGGDGGGRASSGYRDQPKGGQSGGYIGRWFFTDDLPSTVAMTIGGGGAGNTSGGQGGVGSVTSFGSYLVGIKGIGAEYNDGAQLPDKGVPPGNGGDGVFTPGTGDSDILIPSTDGQGGPFAAGGRAGFGTGSTAVQGLDGDAAPANIPSGGGGGGGGSAAAGFVGDGGDGGFPGGAGGGAGKLGLFYGDGGDGAAGCIFVVTT